MKKIAINGQCQTQFSKVEQAFRDNFESQDEVGAAVAIYINNRKVVDLWGGYCDSEKQKPLTSNTLFTVWSLGKALAAVCVLRLVDAGKIDLHCPVANYWPEFAQNGKDKITVAELLSHRAGLVAVETTMPNGAWQHWQMYVAALEQQKPWWSDNTRHGYHVHTYGFLLGELLKRVDGRSIAQYLQDEISKPLGVDFFYGVETGDLSRIADNIPYFRAAEEYAVVDVDSQTLTHEQRMRYLTYNNPALTNKGELNSVQWRQAVFPSTSPHSNAASIAKIFSALANNGTIDGYRLLSEELIDEAIKVYADGEDAVMTKPTRFGLGFMLTMPQRPLGPNPRTFGHYGNAGLLGFADPDAGLSFCYTMNRQGWAWRDPRNIALVDAMYESI